MLRHTGVICRISALAVVQPNMTNVVTTYVDVATTIVNVVMTDDETTTTVLSCVQFPVVAASLDVVITA